MQSVEAILMLWLFGSGKAENSSHAISCVECLDDHCLNVTKVWRAQNGKDSNVWHRNGLGNSIPGCRFYPPLPGPLYHVCKQNHSVFMMTNDSEAGVTFTLEVSGKPVKTGRKMGKECPTLKPEQAAISCVECLYDRCLNVTKVWCAQNGKDSNVWLRNGLGNSIQECRFYSSLPGPLYHVCKQNHSVFMVTNKSEAECPILESESEKRDYTTAISVKCPTKKYVVILFQPVNIICNYDTSSTQPPVVTWRYKSYCRDPIQAALNPSSTENALANAIPNYNANIECADSQRTVRIVASKQGNAVTLGEMYQGRKISIMNKADLNIAQTAWGDSGVYVCSVVSAQDLTGNSEDYTEVIVLERKSNTTDLLPGIDLLVMEDWLLVVLLVLGFLLLLLLIGICWCQCCPHTCCCYVSCPCCPERCCCPRALYEAGKAVKSGMAPSQYAPTMYAPSMYAQPVYGGGMNPPAIPMLPLPNSAAGPPPSNGYSRDYDGASSVGQGSQVPLLQESGGNATRSGYRIQATPDGNPTRVLYYMERELANLDPTRPGDSSGNYNRMDVMSEVSSLHDGGDPRSRGRAQPPALATVYDQDDNMSTISSVSQQGRRGDDHGRRGGAARYSPARGRARSMDNLDDIGRGYRDRDDYPPQRREDGPRGGRRGSDGGGGGRGGYERDRASPRRRDYSPDDRRGYQARRSRSRDDLMDLERERGRGAGRDAYDDSFLREAMEKKKLGEQQRARSRDRLDSDADRSDRGRGPRGPPPLPHAAPSSVPNRRQYSADGFPPAPPPPYSDDESVSSSKKSNLRKNGAVSRESLVV